MFENVKLKIVACAEKTIGKIMSLIPQPPSLSSNNLLMSYDLALGFAVQTKNGLFCFLHANARLGKAKIIIFPPKQKKREVEER